MREIKFRAFHKQEQKMYPVWGTLLNGVYLASPGDLVNQRYFDNTLTCVDIAEVELMQYTGLTDKQGKEIYEGDIVKCYNGVVDVHFNSVIEWQVEHIQDDCSDVPLQVAGFIIGSLAEVEVVGNIYEHQDLLPKKP
jgi:uncharacterized phage protein (TIGR01671 family)